MKMFDKNIKISMDKKGREIYSFSLEYNLDLFKKVGLLSKKNVKRFRKYAKKMKRGLEYSWRQEWDDSPSLLPKIAAYTSGPAVFMVQIMDAISKYVTKQGAIIPNGLEWPVAFSPLVITMGAAMAGMYIKDKGYDEFYNLDKIYPEFKKTAKQIQKELESEKAKQLLSLPPEKIKEKTEKRFGKLKKMFTILPSEEEYSELKKTVKETLEDLEKGLDSAKDGLKLWKKYRC
jgi:hypothetical protein